MSVPMKIGASLLLTVLMLSPATQGRAQEKRTRRIHVKVWDTGKQSDGRPDIDKRDHWRLIEPGSPSGRQLAGDVIVENNRLLAALLRRKGELVVYSKARDVKKRGRMGAVQAADGKPVFASKGDPDYQEILSSLKRVIHRREPGVRDLLAAGGE